MYMYRFRMTFLICVVVLAGALPLTASDRVLAGSAKPTPEVIEVLSEVDRIGGTTCRKVGQKRVTSAGRFQCTKLGRQLKWRLVRTTPTTTTTLPLHVDPTISGAESLQDPSVCRIRDISTDGSGSSGFPRPESVRSGLGQVEVLVIPVGFADLPFSVRDSVTLESVYSRAGRYYEAMSFGRASIRTTIAPEHAWVVLDGTLEQNGLINTPPQYDASHFFRKIVEHYSRSNTIEGYDVVSVVSASSHRFGIGQGLTSGSSIYGTYRSFSGMLILGRAAASWEVLAHEIGHAWLGFEDLYLFGGGAPLARWDLMSASGAELSGWSRFLAGWIDDNRVRCANPRIRSRHHLASLNAGPLVDQSRALIVPLNSHTALVVELRTPGEWAEVDRPYVIMYRIDTSINHGQGPIQFVGLASRVGGSVESNSIRVEIVALGSNAVIVEITHSSE
jgi:M6 family metalloprotease-like protein